MHRLILIFSTLLLIVLSLITLIAKDNTTSTLKENESIQLSKYRQLYEELKLENEVCFVGFCQAMKGFDKIEVKKNILTFIDFSKASTEERFYVIDIEQKKILYKSVVAHGKNSGGNYTTSFSNKKGSNQSSLGFFLTDKTYQGRNGLSLVLKGLEKGINDNAQTRAVVIHGADYANPKMAKSAGRLGRSFGCPALPQELTKPIIEAIKDGSLIYAYSDNFNNEYLKNSTIL